MCIQYSERYGCGHYKKIRFFRNCKCFGLMEHDLRLDFLCVSCAIAQTYASMEDPEDDSDRKGPSETKDGAEQKECDQGVPIRGKPRGP